MVPNDRFKNYEEKVVRYSNCRETSEEEVRIHTGAKEQLERMCWWDWSEFEGGGEVEVRKGVGVL